MYNTGMMLQEKLLQVTFLSLVNHAIKPKVLEVVLRPMLWQWYLILIDSIIFLKRVNVCYDDAVNCQCCYTKLSVLLQ